MCFLKNRGSEYKDFTLNAAGEYIYSGDYMEYAEENSLPYIKMRRLLPGLSSASAVAALASGLFAAPGSSDRFFIILPLTGTIACAFLAVYCALRYAMAGNPMRRFDYDRIMGAFFGRLKACAFFAAITLLAYFVHIIASGMGDCKLWAALLFPLLVASSGAAASASCGLLKGQVWITQEKARM